MAAPSPRASTAARVGPSGAILAVALGGFSLTTDLPGTVALVVAGAGVATALVLRAITGGRRSDSAAAVVLLTIGVLGASAPDTRWAALGGGASVLALMLWLSDEPGRVAGGPRRALPAIGVTGLAFAGAWLSSTLLPSSPVSIGIVAGLLVVVILLATTLLARPAWIEREASTPA
jgi:hypothetical protein